MHQYVYKYHGQSVHKYFEKVFIPLLFTSTSEGQVRVPLRTTKNTHYNYTTFNNNMQIIKAIATLLLLVGVSCVAASTPTLGECKKLCKDTRQSILHDISQCQA